MADVVGTGSMYGATPYQGCQVFVDLNANGIFDTDRSDIVHLLLRKHCFRDIT